MISPPANREFRHTDGSITVLRRVSFGRTHRFPQRFSLDTIIKTPSNLSIVFEIERREIPEAELQGVQFSMIDVRVVDDNAKNYNFHITNDHPTTGPPRQVQRTYWVINKIPFIGIALVVKVYLITIQKQLKNQVFLYQQRLDNTQKWRSQIERSAKEYYVSSARLSDDLATAMSRDNRDSSRRAHALIKAGARVTNADKVGFTDLIWALYKKDVALAKLLLMKDQRIGYICGIDGRTPLMWAAEGGVVEIVRMLIQQGVDIHVRDSYGQTALDLAKQKNRTNVVHLLESVT
jgi:hypothetical protein